MSKHISLVVAVLVCITGWGILAADTAATPAAVAIPGASKVWGAGGSWANYAEVVTKVESGDVSAASIVDDATYRVCKKMAGGMTGAELLAYANGKKTAWFAEGSTGVGCYYQLLRFAARNESDADQIATVVAACKAAMAVPKEAAAAANALYWIYADAHKCGDALLYWQPHFQPRSLYNVVDLGVRNGTVTPERGYIVIRDYLYTVPSQLDGATACRLYDQALRLTVRAGITPADLKAAVSNLDQLYAGTDPNDADWTRFRAKLTNQLAAFKRAQE